MTTINMTIEIVAKIKKGVSVEDALETMNVTMDGAKVDIVNSEILSEENT